MNIEPTIFFKTNIVLFQVTPAPNVVVFYPKILLFGTQFGLCVRALNKHEHVRFDILVQYRSLIDHHVLNLKRGNKRIKATENRKDERISIDTSLLSPRELNREWNLHEGQGCDTAINF